MDSWNEGSYCIDTNGIANGIGRMAYRPRIASFAISGNFEGLSFWVIFLLHVIKKILALA
jgi:hypothetical protein